MRIVAKGTLRAFWEQPAYRDSEQQLSAWYQFITEHDWNNPNEIIAFFRGSDQVGNGRIVFNICHNKYRLIVYFRYEIQIGYVRFIGTHNQYDQIGDIKNI